MLLFVGMVAAVAIHHALRPLPRPVPPPPKRCGVWPDFLPCGRCAYGHMRWPNGSVMRHRVAEGETCETIGRLYNVPAFDIYNRNKSMGCCALGDSNTSVTDVLDFCAPPSLLQWSAAGHPRQPAATGVIKSYIGTGSMGLLPPTSVPRSVNVVALGPVDDLPPPNGPAETAHKGVFRVSPTFTGNCSAQIDPTQSVRGTSESDPDRTRVWLATMVPNYGFKQLPNDNGNWGGGGLSADEWGRNAAVSLGRIILRYRLDGIDINIENGQGSPAIRSSSPVEFGNYICAMLLHLQTQLSKDIVTSLTFYIQTMPHYNEVAKQCGQVVTLANFMTYTTNLAQVKADIATLSSVYGWNRSLWSIIDQPGHVAPEIAGAVAIVQEFRAAESKPRGVSTRISMFSACRYPRE